MKIGVDIRIFAKGMRTGVEEYTINLLSHLLPKDKSIKYRLFYNAFREPDLKFEFLKLSNVKLKIWRIPNRIFDLFLRFLRFPKLDKILGKVDIFLSPHFLLTPLSKGIKRIIVFYDLAFIRFPEFFSFRKWFWHRFMYSKKQAQKADLIVAISQSTKEDLINLYKIEPEKIKVIYPGISKKFRPINKNSQNLLKVKKKYNLPDDFILYFGTIEPRKNILGLVKAFERLKSQDINFLSDIRWQGFEGRVGTQEKKNFDFLKLKLVIAGVRGWLYEEIFESVEKSLFKKDIIFTGFIEDEDKPYLYNLADVFVYPSFFEGFGLPPLEAMACGVPAVVSNKSSLSEVVGRGAVMIDAHNIDEITLVVREILENQALKRYLIEQGLKRAKQFNWNKTATQFLKHLKDYENRN